MEAYMYLHKMYMYASYFSNETATENLTNLLQIDLICLIFLLQFYTAYTIL